MISERKSRQREAALAQKVETLAADLERTRIARDIHDSTMIRILLADDQPLFREGLVALLSLEEDLEVLGKANHGLEAIALAEQLQSDVMDVRMPICNGVDATREIHHSYPWI